MSEEEYEKGYEELKSIKKPMKADEMFEKLGYKVEHHIAYIKYNQEIKQNCCDDVKELQIWFYPFDETFEKVGGLITLEELQAINEKVKELGWLNE